MRQPRIKIPDATAVYHCISRCAGNQFLFDTQDKEQFRLFGDGLVLGSAAYVEEIFQRFRDRYGKTRRTGARKLRGLPFDQLRTLRDLRVNPVS